MARRRWTPWLAGVAVAVSGCLAAAVEPKAIEPEGTGTPWTSWDGAVATASYGCGGPCAGPFAQGAEFTWVGVDGGGRVLRVDWALGERPGVRFMDPVLEPWNSTVAPLFAAGDEYGQHGNAGVRVFAIRAVRMDEADRLLVDRVLDDARGRLEPLGPPVYDCDDCGAPVLKADGLRVELHGNAPEGSGWPLLGEQMRGLAEWAGDADGGQGS